MTKLNKVLSVLFMVSMALLIVTGCSAKDDSISPTDSVETVTLMDNQSYVIYSHSDDNGHWFIDSNFGDNATLYVDDTLWIDGTVQGKQFIATYVDSDKWELVSLESVK